MLLDEADIAEIVEHLGGEVQFYDARGVAANTAALSLIRDALGTYIGARASKSEEQRSELVKIAFKETLKQLSEGNYAQWKIADMEQWTIADVARHAVKLADATLAAMEKTPDTGPSAEEKPADGD